MPARSKKQQRYFGMVRAYQKGKLPGASKQIRDTAQSISADDARDFARTKHDKLPEKSSALTPTLLGSMLGCSRL